LILSPSTLPPGAPDASYEVTFSASDGASPYTFSHGGSLPTGLSLNSTTGVLSGTVTGETGAYAINVTATDTNGCFITNNYDLVISNCPTITINSLDVAFVGYYINASATASGGQPPYTFSVTSGTLPDGLSVVSVGSSGEMFLVGTPSTAGSVTITATDSNECSNTFVVYFGV
jgi:hypothetical protein